VLGLLKFGVKYVFSQRRTDINDIISDIESKIRSEERKRIATLSSAALMEGLDFQEKITARE
jgi:hypothetical protein